MSYTVSSATLTPVSAFIYTPVFASVLAVHVTETMCSFSWVQPEQAVIKGFSTIYVHFVMQLYY